MFASVPDAAFLSVMVTAPLVMIGDAAWATTAGV